MPTYDFICPSCSREAEVRLHSWQDPSPPCSACGAAMSRKFSPSLAISTRGHEAAPRGTASLPPPRRPTPAETRDIPVVTKDGGLVSAAGRKLLNPDGSKA